MAAQSRSSAAGKGLIVAVLLALAAVWASPAAADPPDWAPAHGYRAKHKHKYKYKQRHEEEYEHYASYVAPIDIRLGRCNRIWSAASSAVPRGPRSARRWSTRTTGRSASSAAPSSA